MGLPSDVKNGSLARLASLVGNDKGLGCCLARGLSTKTGYSSGVDGEYVFLGHTVKLPQTTMDGLTPWDLYG